MLRNITQIEFLIEGKKGGFYCDMDTPLNIAKEMHFQCGRYIAQIEDQIKSQQEALKEQQEKKEEEEKKEEPKPVE
jgi:vacuolar-type H+-ATPase subunit I/STV1